MEGTWLVLLAFAIFVALGCGVFFVRRRRFPFVHKKRAWSIGIMGGAHPLEIGDHERVRNPVLTSRHVTDVDADFVADPFLVHDERGWAMFFEVMNRSTGLGEIGLARSKNGLRWRYDRIVLREPFHLSYPFVFGWRGRHFMVPECCRSGTIRLYEALNYPDGWVHRATLVEGEYVDPTPFVWNDHWYMMAKERASHTLRLFEAGDLCGPWSEHPRSPLLVDDLNHTRPGGNVTVSGGRLYRFAQDYEPRYGSKVWAMEITDLTPDCYEERPAGSRPVLAAGMSGRSWNSQGMHQLSPIQVGEGRWIAAVDGNGYHYSLSWKL